MKIKVTPLSPRRLKRVQSGIQYTEFPKTVNNIGRNMGKIPHKPPNASIFKFAVNLEVSGKELDAASMHTDTWVGYVIEAIKKAGLQVESVLYDGWRGNNYSYQVICNA